MPFSIISGVMSKAVTFIPRSAKNPTPLLFFEYYLGIAARQIFFTCFNLKHGASRHYREILQSNQQVKHKEQRACY